MTPPAIHSPMVPPMSSSMMQMLRTFFTCDSAMVPISRQECPSFLASTAAVAQAAAMP